MTFSVKCLTSTVTDRPISAKSGLRLRCARGARKRTSRRMTTRKICDGRGLTAQAVYDTLWSMCLSLSRVPISVAPVGRAIELGTLS